MRPSNNPPGTPLRVEISAELRPLIPRYLENRRTDLSRLRKAVGEGDFATIRSIGHSIKGTGGGFGFPVITTIGAELETSGGDQDRDAARDAVERLAEFLDRADVVYVE